MNSRSNSQRTFVKLLCALSSSTALLLNPAASSAPTTSSPTVPATPRSDGLASTASDAAITSKLKLKLAGNSALKQSDISVSTFNGVVTLYGVASNRAAKTLAEAEATRIEGVKGVDASALLIGK
ncbi:BON domain-containing protein [Uliginosibacterium sediminicola]|uniref:BON domain-containing protein n=1 Tax=Uliginosibacterium sediminicola TaxID=2024550 RepID=A0ABU9Z0X2_9RHOO